MTENRPLEALKKILGETRSYCEKESHESLVERFVEDPLDYTCIRDSLLEIDELTETVLARPPRNCDVGTPDEQNRRWEKFCIEHHEPWKGPSCRVETMTKCRSDCPCLAGNSCNQFVWTQLPYEEKA